MQRLAREPAVRVYINPRRWDSVISQALNKNDLLQGAAWHLWDACQYVVSTIEIGQPIRIGTYANINRAQLPQELLNLTDNLVGSADFLEQVPADSMVAAAGRMELFRLAEYLLAGLEPDRRASIDTIRSFAAGMLLGQDLVDDILPQLGPNLGAFLLPETSPHQPDWVIGAQVRPPSDPDQPTMDETLDAALGILGVIPQRVDSNNADPEHADEPDQGDPSHPAARVIARDGVDYTEVTGLGFLPRDLSLTYAFNADYLFAGTSTDAVHRAIQLNPQASFARSSRFHSLLNRPVAEPSHLLFVDCRQLEALLANHRDVLIDALAAAGGGGGKMAERRVTDLRRWLGMVESLLFAAQVDNEGFALSITVAERTDDDARAD